MDDGEKKSRSFQSNTWMDDNAGKKKYIDKSMYQETQSNMNTL